MLIFLIIIILVAIIASLTVSSFQKNKINPYDRGINDFENRMSISIPKELDEEIDLDDDYKPHFEKGKVWLPGEPYMIIGDVETSGLRKYRNADPLNLSNWPRIVQLAYHVFDIEGKELDKVNVIFKQPRPLPPDCIKIHGITDQMCKDLGVKPEPILAKLNEYSRVCFFFVGHNVDFDLGVIEANMRRFKIADDFRMYSQCTMLQSKGLKGMKSLDRNGRKKNPRLEEVYEFLFGELPAKQHDAGEDTLATIRCYYEMKARGVMD